MPDKQLKNYEHPVFTGLSEKALVAFFSLGNVEHFEPGQVLLEEGAEATDSFLILKGQCALAKGNPSPVVVHTLNQGNYLPLTLYRISADGSEYSIRAVNPLSVFRFNEQKVGALPPEIQLLINRNLWQLSAANSSRLLQQQISQASSRQILARQLLEEINYDYKYYSGNKPILDLLRKIPRLPSYATRLTQMLADEEVSTKEAFETAKLDPSLTASVLKQVNSASYGLKHKVMDFQHAFVLLGFNQINQIVMNQGLSSTMPKAPEFQQLQLHCVMVSALCQEIALSTGQGAAPTAATIGLLHDIGKSVILLLKREHAKLSFMINLLNADLLGSLLLREWEIPDDICYCMQYQALPYKAPPYVIPEQHRINMAILYIAHLCFDFLMEKEIENRQLRFFDEYLGILGCEAETPEDFIRDTLLPSVKGRLSSMPKVIQNFLKKGQTLLDQRSAEAAEGPKLDLEGVEESSEEAKVA